MTATRRACILGLAAAFGVARPAVARWRMRTSINRLHVVFVPTGREWRGFWDPAAPDAAAMDALSALCFDYRARASAPIDPDLWSALAANGGDLGIARWEVVSGYRSIASNIEVGGAVNSQHRRGRALDLRLPPALMERMARRVLDMRLGGAGLYPGHAFLHIDTRGTPVAWYG